MTVPPVFEKEESFLATRYDLALREEVADVLNLECVVEVGGSDETLRWREEVPRACVAHTLLRILLTRCTLEVESHTDEVLAFLTKVAGCVWFDGYVNARSLIATASKGLGSSLVQEEQSYRDQTDHRARNNVRVGHLKVRWQVTVSS